MMENPGLGRREFVSLAAMAVTAASMGGTTAAPSACAPMHGFVAPKLEKVRVGVIGIGGRGASAVDRLCKVPGTVITAICDLIPDRVKWGQATVKNAGFPEPKGFVGPEGHKQLSDSGLCDVVYIVTNWTSHFEIALYAINAGRHLFMEVPGCRTIEEGWKLIEASEKNHVYCSVLANCCYGEHELEMIIAVHAKAFGEIMHAEGCYLHNTRAPAPQGDQGFLGPDKIFPSLRALVDHTGMCYPVHQFSPIALALDINRGDRLDHLVSMGNQGFAWQEVAKRKYGPDAPVSKIKFEANDFNTTLLRTAKGKTIELRQCNNSPMPYTREYRIYGFDGSAIFNVCPMQIALEQKLGFNPGGYLQGQQLTDFYLKYRSPMWTHYENLRKLGGHGGMDYYMDFRWTYCLRTGTPLDIDVYDLATWSSIFELSERSVRNRSAVQDVPDFTRGKWATTPPIGDMSVPKGYV